MVENDKEENVEKKAKSAKPSWIKMKPADLEKVVVELAKKGELPERIGLILRDEHGVPKAKLFGKKITQILKENSLMPESERDVLDKKIEHLKGHISKNKHDYCATKALTKKLWGVYQINKKAQ